MKVIFLDVDGVLNNNGTDRSRYNPTMVDGYREHHYVGIDPVHVAFLNDIIEKSGAKVVLSSTWRISFGKENTLHTMRLSGYKHDIIDVTPDGSTDREVFTPKHMWDDVPRGNEIAAWMERYAKAHPEDPITHWVVLDDNDLKHVQTNEKLVKTEWYPQNTEGGLREQHVSDVLKHLGVDTTPIGA